MPENTHCIVYISGLSFLRDGQPRIDNLLPLYLGADENNYTKEIMRLLMLAAIKDEWFSDDLKRMDDDNVYRKMQGR